MTDEQKNVVLKYTIEVDQSKANQVAQTFRQQQQAIKDTTAEFGKHQDGIKSLLRSYSDWEVAARKITTVGRDAAIAGAAILAPFVTSAAEYSKRYGQLEQVSRNFIAAQQAQQNAVSNLGRVSAAALTPIYNQSAAFLDKVAQFASAHPDLVSSAVTVGGGLAAGGAALVAAGTAISAVAKAGDLLKTAFSGSGVGSLTGAAATTAVNIAALGAGALAGVAIVNKVGEATGNETLAHYQLTDTLKTVRELIATAAIGIAQAFADAKVTVGRIGDVFTGIAALVKNKFETIADQVATAFRVLAIDLGKFTTDLYNATIAKLPGKSPIAYRVGRQPADQIDAEAAGFKDRQAQRDADLAATGSSLAANEDARQKQYQIDQNNIKKIADFATAFVKSGSLGPAVDAILGKIGTTISTFIGNFTGGKPPSATTNGQPISPEEVQDYLDYSKAKIAADKQYAADSAKITSDYNASEVKAKADNADKLAQIDQETADNAQKIRDAQAKATADFYDSERQTDEKNALAKKQRQQQLDAQLSDLAANRDVAGYLAAQKAGALADQQQTDQEALDKQQRLEQFNKQQADFKQQLADNDGQGKKKRDQQNTQFTNEERDRKSAYQQQLADLKQHHIDENNTLEADFATKLAALQGNIAGLSSIQSAYYGQAAIDAQNFVNNQRSILQQLYASSIGASVPANGGSATPPPSPVYGQPSTYAPSPSTPRDVSAPYIPTFHLNGGGFAKGLKMVSEDGLYPLHKFESVRTAAQTANDTGGQINVTINNTVGDVASMTALNQAETRIVGHVVDAIEIAREALS